MKQKLVQRLVMIGLAGSFLSASIGLAADKTVASGNVRATAQPAARRQTSRTTQEFKSERTDSWLCNYVSPMFCSNLFPTLSPTSGTNNSPSSVPDRSRH